MELPACAGESSAPCTLRCGTRANGCVSYAEYTPLAANADETRSLRFGPIDPEGSWAFYRDERTRGPREATLYRWSAEGGDVALADALGLPAANPELPEATVVLEVGAAGDAILLLGYDDEVANHGYVWTRDAGLARLDFVPWDMSADGGVVVGSRGGPAVVWDRAAGVRRLDGAALDATPFTPPDVVPDELARLISVRWMQVSDSGDHVLSVENSGRGFRWSAALGVRPLAAQPGFPEGASVELVDLEAGVFVARTPRTERQPDRLWWWSEAVGAREIGDLSDQGAPFRRSVSLLRAAGDVVVGDEAATYGNVAVVRWSAALGAQRVSPPSTLSVPLYVNAAGTTIVGQSAVGVPANTFRWTASGGTSVVLEGGVASLVALDGDVLVAPGSSDGSRWSVLKFDRALEADAALPIDLIATGPSPGRDAVESSIQLVSENARLLAGTTRDGLGVTRAWVIRLRDTCTQ